MSDTKLEELAKKLRDQFDVELYKDEEEEFLNLARFVAALVVEARLNEQRKHSLWSSNYLEWYRDGVQRIEELETQLTALREVKK